MKPSEAIRRFARGERERSGFFFSLLLIYLIFEFGRPANPLNIPMLLSIVLLGWWLMRPDKLWSPQITGYLTLLLAMAISMVLAANNYSAFWATYGMAVLLLCICAPLPSLITSVPRIQAWAYTFVAVAFYVGAYAIFHEGYGPAGAAGGQDENYVAAMMAMAIPFAYFSIFTARRRIAKALLAICVAVFCGAIVVSFSRGGFLGFCAVLVYCVARSPKKWIGFGAVAIIGLSLLLFAGPAYWEEMSTITDTKEATADMRLELWTIGMRMFLANPVFGVGPDNFRWQVGKYESPEQLEKFDRDLGGSAVAHSLFVELLADWGSVGAVVVAALLWRTFKDLKQVRLLTTHRPHQSRSTEDLVSLRCYADAVTASILACLVTGAFLSLLYFSYMWLLIALGSAITHVFRARVVVLQREA